MKYLKDSIEEILEIEQKIIQTEKEVKVSVDELITNKPNGPGPLSIQEADSFWAFVNKAASLNRRLSDQKKTLNEKLDELKFPLKLLGLEIRYSVPSDHRKGIDGGNYIFSYNEQEDLATMRKE